MRKTYQTNTPWEPIVGYSRAVRLGPHVFVTGTTATNSEGTLIGIGDASAQTEQVLRNVRAALEAVGARIEDVVRTRIYVTNIERDWEAIGRIHGAVFGHVRPATTMVEVARLIDERMLVEIEADALVSGAAATDSLDTQVLHVDASAED